MRPTLSDRLRGIVGGSHATSGGRVPVPPAGPASSSPSSGRQSVAAQSSSADRALRAAHAVAGAVVEREDGVVVRIDRFYAGDRPHGRDRIGAIVGTLLEGQDALATLARSWPMRRTADGVRPPASYTGRLLFLDLETTGLAGGAGTQAFLVGCASVADDGLEVRQFLLPGFEHERALLGAVAAWAAEHGALVTFNGRSFDVPLIETRYLFHRLSFPLDGVPHLDMLHPSRRLWKARPAVAGPPLDEDRCTLGILERHLGGVHRVGDVPGHEIPARFFAFVRAGEARALEAVLEHNRLDLLSLALVTARALRLIQHGAPAARHSRECLGLGRLFERAGRADDAEACYAEAAARAARVGREPDVRAEALGRLAMVRRRAGRHADAAAAWQALLAAPGCPAAFRREAREALAIHHEHRVRDLEAARLFVLDAMADAPEAGWRARAVHRLRRLERKLGAGRGVRPVSLQW